MHKYSARDILNAENAMNSGNPLNTLRLLLAFRLSFVQTMLSILNESLVLLIALQKQAWNNITENNLKDRLSLQFITFYVGLSLLFELLTIIELTIHSFLFVATSIRKV